MSAAMGGPAPREGDRIELRGGRLVDVVRGRYFPPEVRIVIRRGVIEAMPGLPGQPGRVGADLVADLGGRAVMPGLFNTHCHVQFVTPALILGVGDPRRILRHRRAQIRFGMSDCLSRGITVVRDALTENLSSSRKLRSSISRGEIPGPRIEQAILVCPLGGAFAPVVSPVEGLMMSLAGLPPVDYESDRSGIVVFPPDAGPAGVRDAVSKAAGERGAGCIKFYDQREKKISYRPGAVMMTQRQLDAAADQARRLGLRTTLHHLTVESFRRGIRAGVSSLAHLPFDGNLTGDDARAFLGSGCFIEPTLSIAYDYSRLQGPGPWPGRPWMERLEELRKRTYGGVARDCWIDGLRGVFTRGMERAFGGRTRTLGLIDMSHVYDYFSGFAVAGARNLRVLLEHGAASRMGCGNDAGACSCSPSAVLQELEMFDFFFGAQAGGRLFDGAAALRLATLGSARCVGLDGDLGSIEPGKRADLAIVDGDPLGDFRVIGSPVAALFLDGRLVVNRCGLALERAGEGRR